MATATQSYGRDANRVPITDYGLMVTAPITFDTTNGHFYPLFTVTGTVKVKALYGIVTTALGSNATAAYFRLYDQTSTTTYISANSGVTISSASIGSLLARITVLATTISFKNSLAGAVLDPIAATAPDSFMPFILVQKTGSILTEIEFTFATNNSSGGAITFYCGYIPLSPDGNISVSTTAAHA